MDKCYTLCFAIAPAEAEHTRLVGISSVFSHYKYAALAMAVCNTTEEDLRELEHTRTHTYNLWQDHQACAHGKHGGEDVGADGTDDVRWCGARCS